MQPSGHQKYRQPELGFGAGSATTQVEMRTPSLVVEGAQTAPAQVAVQLLKLAPAVKWNGIFVDDMHEV